MTQKAEDSVVEGRGQCCGFSASIPAIGSMKYIFMVTQIHAKGVLPTQLGERKKRWIKGTM